MKKIAISAILIGLMGFAQADVTVYGKMRVYEESSTVAGASVTSLTNDTSRIGFKGSEDLGNGIKANFTIEAGVGADAPSASTIGDRVSTVGLSSSIGSVAFGRDKHSLTKAIDNFDAMGGVLFGSSAGITHTAQGTRISNGVFFSASPVTGLAVNYQFANSEVAGTPNTQAASLVYSTGPLSVTVARYDNGLTSASNLYGAKFNMAKSGTTLFTMYSDDTVAGVSKTGKSIGVTQVLGKQVTALASYGENNTTKSYNVGANYALSKNTLVLARYVKETAATDTQRVGLGLEMNF